MALLFLLASGLGCGKRGEPLPPIRVVPQPVTDVKLAQSGRVVRLTYTMPRLMTDGSRPPVLEIERQLAEGQGDFAKLAKKTTRQAAPGEALSEEFPLPAPKTALRVSLRASAKGRFSNPSPLITLVAREPVEIPASLCVEHGYETGARLEWAAIAPPSPLAATASGAVGAPSSLPSSPRPTPEPSVSPAPSPAAGPSPGPSPTPSPSPPAVTYRVFRRAENDAFGAPLTALLTAATEYDDTDAPTEATSCYVVRAVVSSEPLIESADSNEVCIRLEDILAPPTPGGVAAFVRDRNVEVVWDAIATPDLGGYRVKRGTPGGEPVLLKEVDAATTSFTDTTAEPGVVYLYSVSAFDKAGNESPASPQAQAGTQ